MGIREEIIKQIMENNRISQNDLFSLNFDLEDKVKREEFDKEVVERLCELQDVIWERAQKQLLEETRKNGNK